MAVVEIVLPQIKKDPESAKGAVGVYPFAFNAFKNGGVIRGLQGRIVSEDGKDTSSDSRGLLVLEWPEVSTFQSFIQSPAFAEFAGAMKPFSSGPPDLSVFETNPASHLFGTHPVLEVLVIRPKNPSNESEVQTILKKIQSNSTKSSDTNAVYGSTVNLPEKRVGVLRIFANKEELADPKNASLRQDIKSEIGSLADITQLVAEVKSIPL
ncbi:uncharacterized protein F4822DRAFT_161585 [Hypoxylon trugodes]|uniref:uncharacterized protein n=1 Tax=Hypoxylon trugodes TaxID=326681 RepID=UPI00218DF452|nr:uncharacterized protein F4822DRAFT_161585 [Hypoxylon trugodes]KAI1390701.1 hypothetical protein F4822DRAFT_161585 [Hypoxylon trugodes]